MKKKVLIIKTGYSEFLDSTTNSRIVSLGDILRTTPILHVFKDDHVTWVTDIKAFPLLKNNYFIDSLLPYDFTTVLQLQSEKFDYLVNLEKVPGICALTDKIQAWRKFGFRFDSETGEALAYDKAFDVLAVSSDHQIKKANEKTSQELLYELVGEKWSDEPYILDHNVNDEESFDIALNTNVGSKYPNKKWSIDNWDKLEKILLLQNFTVTRQDKQSGDVLTNLDSYVSWLNSAKIIISNDSLGMHIGFALNKIVIGLFGPTPDKEVYFYRGFPITPEIDCSQRPCFKPFCSNGYTSCIDLIEPDKVYKQLMEYITKNE